MKYYLDTEFHEYQRKPLFSKPFRTIELISIGIVAEDGRAYYAISKDFDLKAAWNSYQEEVNMDYKPSFGGGNDGHYNPMMIRTYWLRANVLRKLGNDINTFVQFKQFIGNIGKSNAQIAEEVKEFTLLDTNLRGEREILKVDGDFIYYDNDPVIGGLPPVRQISKDVIPPEFYAYFADYDWVVFCWLFGKMIDLPKGFPKYCRDLKQMFDEIQERTPNVQRIGWGEIKERGLKNKDAFIIKNMSSYPQQSNEHNALADARWNKELHKFIEKL